MVVSAGRADDGISTVWYSMYGMVYCATSPLPILLYCIGMLLQGFSTRLVDHSVMKKKARIKITTDDLPVTKLLNGP